MNETHGMRSQKFGVEIETKGLGLAEAARVIAQALGGTAYGTQVTDPPTGKVWKAVPDRSLHGVSAEIVTPILTYEELPKLQEVVRALRSAGGPSGQRVRPPRPRRRLPSRRREPRARHFPCAFGLRQCSSIEAISASMFSSDVRWS